MTRQILHIFASLLILGVCLEAASAEVSFPQIAKLTALDAAAGDSLGDSVAISGNTVIVGAPFDDDLGGASGAAYIFERNAGGPDAWGQVAKLTAPGGAAADWFGTEVALDGDTAIVAASVNDLSRLGYAYIFERNAGGPGAWGEVARLGADDGEPFDSYGSAVAVAGDFAAVGAPFADLPGGGGAVYIYERNAGGADAWGQTAKLTPAAACPDSPSYCGWWSDKFFGTSVSFSGDTVAVGDSEVSGGASYLFRRNEEGKWRRIGKPISSDFTSGDLFGSSVAVSGRTLLVPAPDDNNDNGLQAGSVYAFALDQQSRPIWTEVAMLIAPDGEEGDRFGWSADLSGDTAVIGAIQSGSGRDWQGEAFVFQRIAGGWEAVANLVADDGVPSDVFGGSVGISGDTVVVGADGHDSDTGAAYVFQATAVSSSIGAPEIVANDEKNPVLGRQEAAGPRKSVSDLGRPEEVRLPESETSSERRSIAGPYERTTASGTQFCFEFTGFTSICDGLELTISGRSITGSWRVLNPSFFCDDFDITVSGSVQDGRALVWCDSETNVCPEGFTWGWIIDLPLDGSMIMLQRDAGLWHSWFDELPYIGTPGPCQ